VAYAGKQIMVIKKIAPQNFGDAEHNMLVVIGVKTLLTP